MNKTMKTLLGGGSLLLSAVLAVIAYFVMNQVHRPMPWSDFSIAAACISFAPSLAITGVVFLLLGTDKRV